MQTQYTAVKIGSFFYTNIIMNLSRVNFHVTLVAIGIDLMPLKIEILLSMPWKTMVVRMNALQLHHHDINVLKEERNFNRSQ